MPSEENILQFPPSMTPKCHICGDTTDYKINRACKRCGQAYCLEHASKVDPTFCEHCFLGVVIQEESFQRTEEHYDEETDTVKIVKSPTARKQSFSGVDWVFFNNSIKEKSEEELKLQLKFYRAAVSAMEMELTTKIVRKMSGLRMAGGTVSKKVTTTTTKKTVKVAKPIDLEQLARMMKQAGITPEMIAALGKK